MDASKRASFPRLTRVDVHHLLAMLQVQYFLNIFTLAAGLASLLGRCADPRRNAETYIRAAQEHGREGRRSRKMQLVSGTIVGLP